MHKLFSLMFVVSALLVISSYGAAEARSSHSSSSSSGKVRSSTGNSYYEHTTRSNGDRSLVYGEKGAAEHNHAVISKSGKVKYLREEGKVIVDDAVVEDGLLGTVVAGCLVLLLF